MQTNYLYRLYIVAQRYVLAVILIGGLPVAAFANDFKKGLKAYKNKDYAAAIEHLKVAVDEGDVDALYYLGQSYRMSPASAPHPDLYKVMLGRFVVARGNNYDILYSGAIYDLFAAYWTYPSPELRNKDSALKYAMMAFHMPAIKDDDVPSFICHHAAVMLHPLPYEVSAHGGPKSPVDTLAFLLAKRSALLGFVDGMEVLAAYFKYGIGTEQSNTASIAWCKEAIAHGSDRCRYMLAELTGTKPVFRDGDYRTIDAQQKELAAHPERRLTKADLPGGYVTPEETRAYNAWWDRTYGSGRVQQSDRPAANTQWGTPDKTAKERDQDMYDKMHKEAEQREKSNKDKWGR